MSATVEGVFRIIDRASGPMRRMQAQAIMTDKAIDRLGKRLDQLGSKKHLDNIKGMSGELAASRSEAEKFVGTLSKTETQTTRTGNALRRTGRDSDTFSRGMRMAGRETEHFWSRLIKVGASLISIQKIIGVLKLPAMGAAIGFLVQAVGNLVLGLTALLPRIAQLGGIVAGLPALFGGMALAMGTVKLAFSGLSEAMKGNEKAMKNLTPEARRFVSTLKTYKPVLQELRRSAQQGLFPGLDVALRRAAGAVPTVRRLLRQGGAQIGGGVARIFEEQGAFGGDWTAIGEQAVRTVGRMMRGVGYLVTALRNFMMAARPFANWLIDTLVAWTKWAAEASKAGRETGRIAAWLEKSRRSLILFGHILRNIWNFFVEVGRAASTTGETMWKSAERATAAWVKWSRTVGGQMQMARMFAATRDVMKETLGLVGDLGEAIFRMGMQPGLADNIRALRSAVPAIEHALNTFVTVFLPVLFDVLREALRLLELLTATTGPINIFLGLVAQVLGLFNDLLNTSEAVHRVFNAMFTVVTLGYFISKLGKLALAWRGVEAAAGAAAIAEGAALGVGGAGAARGVAGLTALGMGGGALRTGLTAGKTGGLARLAGLAGLGGVGGRVAGLAGKFAWPIAAVLGAYGALTAPREGSFGMQTAQTLSGAASALTFGIVPRIKTPTEMENERLRRIWSGYTERRTEPLGPMGPGGRAAWLRQATSPERTTTVYHRGIEERIARAGGPDPQTWRQVAALARIYQDWIKRAATVHTEEGREAVRNAKSELTILKQRLAVHQAELNARARERAARLLPRFGDEYNYLRGRIGVRPAFRQTVGDIIGRLDTLPEAGRKVLAEGALKWAAEAARQNPKLVKQYDRLADAVLRSFRRIHRNAQIFNGKILDGSRTQWNLIAAAMTDPLEKVKQKMQEQFTYIQREAVAALMAMGFTRGQARGLVSTMEQGGVAGRVAATQAKTGVYGPQGQGMPVYTKARGGRIGGVGLADSVTVAPGHLAAPGELIVNRHTERRVNAMLGGRSTLGAEVGRESRLHSEPMTYAVGGRLGTLAGLGAAISGLTTALLSRFPGLSVTSTTAGRHAKDSYHYRGQAVDLAGGSRTMNAAARWLLNSGQYRGLLEGIHNPNLSVKNGQVVPPGFWGADTWAGHAGHIHLAAGGTGGALGTGAGPVGATRIGALGVPWTGQPGVAGALSFAVGALMARGMQRAVNRRLTGGPALGGGAGGMKALARRMMLAMGWGAGQWPALEALWMRESGFDPMARNPSSGAFGIPQALPPSKMGPAAVAGDPVAQIRWGLNYIRGRYGTPSRAWQHEKFAGWYGGGGIFDVSTPTLFGAGEGGRRERVSITPVGGRRPGIHIENMNITNNRPGDIRRQVKEEVMAAYADLADAIGTAPMEDDGEVLA